MAKRAKSKRSVAARRGWKSRRQREAQERIKRSQAAKKGWETRRRREREKELARRKRSRAAKRGWQNRKKREKFRAELERVRREMESLAKRAKQAAKAARGTPVSKRARAVEREVGKLLMDLGREVGNLHALLAGGLWRDIARGVKEMDSELEAVRDVVSTIEREVGEYAPEVTMGWETAGLEEWLESYEDWEEEYGVDEVEVESTAQYEGRAGG